MKNYNFFFEINYIFESSEHEQTYRKNDYDHVKVGKVMKQKLWVIERN